MAEGDESYARHLAQELVIRQPILDIRLHVLLHYIELSILVLARG